MADALKRWNGSEWVIVAAVNRIEIGGGGGSSTIIGESTAKLQAVTGGWFAEQITGASTKIE